MAGGVERHDRQTEVHGFDKDSETVGGEVEDGVGEEVQDELREDDGVEIEP